MSSRQTKRLKSRVNLLARRNVIGINGLERRAGVRTMSLTTNCNTISAYDKVALFNMEKPALKYVKTSMGWMYL